MSDTRELLMAFIKASGFEVEVEAIFNRDSYEREYQYSLMISQEQSFIAREKHTTRKYKINKLEQKEK